MKHPRTSAGIDGRPWLRMILACAAVPLCFLIAECAATAARCGTTGVLTAITIAVLGIVAIPATAIAVAAGAIAARERFVTPRTWFAACAAVALAATATVGWSAYQTSLTPVGRSCDVSL